MLLTPEQLFAQQKAATAAVFGFQAKAFEGAEKLAELHLQLAKTALTEAAETTNALLSVKDAQEFVALQTSLLQPNGEKAAAYGRHVADITLTTSAELGKLVEAQMGDAKAKFDNLVENLAKNAPAGTENVVALAKSGLAAANNAFESAQKAAKQVAEVAESNFQTLTAQATKAPRGKKSA
ncbi:phasin family protein [Inhella gelatinilytica]|uniref:Phasin family protein n=1 Tax=Inhella gelatinilytica TaxID=2795030 RepID=A0A931IYY9_9BURK|nr:phasin family protein [Inhella gelatinilytica]MBH9554186.1 phasin family protein [Inhella gelatinilytica]